MRELFASDNFVLKDFLIANKTVPVDELLSQLDKIAKTVQNELFDLINGDLVHFQTILKEACEVDIEAVKQLRNKVEEEKIITEKNYLNYKEYHQEVERRYQRLKYIQQKKAMLVKSKKAHQYIDSFKTRQIKAENSIYELEISVKNYNWLVKFTTEFSAELIEAESDIHRELSQFNERLQEILEIHLKRLLHETKEETDDVRLLVKICKEMKKLNLFEASYKITILYPKLEFLLQESISTSGSLFNFKLFIENLSKFIKELKSDWDHIIKEIYEEEGFKFWNRTILAPILTWIIERCSSVFIPTNLNEFKGNFEKGLSFISEIEEIFFAYEDELMTFRTQPAWINFMKKWALHQYYQISVKQILFPIESVMSHGLELAAEPKLFEPTLICINALKHLWSDEIIIKPLIPKYLKITLQVFRRFIDYCSEDVAFHRNPKVFLLTVIQKQFNLREFINLIEEELMESFEKHLDSLEEGLSQVILNKLKEESKGCFCRSESNNLISDVENLYDQLLLQREEIQSLSLEPLELLKRFEIANDLNQLIQRILLKFNRIIFKLIDEKRIKSSEFSEILKKMEELEGEVKELGCAELVNEEFWLEIKAAINR